MEWLAIVFRFLPMLVQLAENVFVGEKTGIEKKDFVLKALPSIAQGIEEVSTGGQKETWKTINANMDTIGKAVDVTAKIMYPKFTEVSDR